jgi:hypothetical protein
MRHLNSKTTLDIYAKAVTPSKRRADGRIVDGLLAVASIPRLEWRGYSDGNC